MFVTLLKKEKKKKKWLEQRLYIIQSHVCSASFDHGARVNVQ